VLRVPLRSWQVSVVFLAAILLGSLVGVGAPIVAAEISRWTDPLILILVGALFFTLRWDGAMVLRRAPRVVLLAVGMNFLAIPVVALALTALLPHEALRLGVLIYCLAPCTDWFLGFTRIAGGDTTVGAALIPVQMVLQLTLYPIWLALFAGETVDATISGAVPGLLTWFVLPAALGVGARLALRYVLSSSWCARVVDGVDRLLPLSIAGVIVAVFAGNVHTIAADPVSFVWVLIVVFVFFVITFLMGEGVARLARLTYAEHALLTMTTSARNAPLMLAVTTATLPGQPVLYAAIILGMLVEFPHLTVVGHLLRRRMPGRALEVTEAAVAS
jgi:ACR3 family arsenite transporter